MNVRSVVEKDCCGCSACYAVCPVNAINMVEDEHGFLRPVIDESTCISCGICLKVCSNKKEKREQSIRAYAARSNDENVLIKSSSGGVSYEFAKKILTDGGVVYGVVYDELHEACHARIDSLDNCSKLFGSKYVQSNPKNTLRQVYDDLKDGKQVLYFGTSCYVAGLLSYLKQKKCSTEKLITVDLICHGVPSPKIFRDYIAFLNKDSKRLDHFSFRTKKFPWGYGSKSFGCTIYWKNGREETDSARARLFLNLFFSNNCIRKHCHFCEYCGFDKPADITIADYWGLKDTHPTFFDERGVSAVITHNEKAYQFFKSTDIVWVDSSIEKISLKQANMSHPSPQSAQCNEFWKDYNKGGFMAVAKKYGGYNIKGIIHRSWMFKIINKMLKRT